VPEPSNVKTDGFIPWPRPRNATSLASEQARAEYLGEFSSRGMELTGLNCNQSLVFRSSWRRAGPWGAGGHAGDGWFVDLGA
jgi:hypothetical protein